MGPPHEGSIRRPIALWANALPLSYVALLYGGLFGLVVMDFQLDYKIMKWWKEGNVLFNDALNTFYLRLYGVKHMVKDHSDREETRCRHMGYSFRLTARDLLYAPSHRQDSTYHGLCYTSRGALAGTRNSSMGPPWRIDPTTRRTMSERSPSELRPAPIRRAIWASSYGFPVGLQDNEVMEGRKEMFYLTTHSTHFIYCYMASNIW